MPVLSRRAIALCCALPFAAAATAFAQPWGLRDALFPGAAGVVRVGPAPRGVTDTTAGTCASCHAEIAREWRASLHGQAWTDDGPVNVKNARFAEDTSPLDERLDCPASRDYSRAYYNHLFKAQELLGPILLSWHNTAYYQGLMARIRAAIADGTFPALRKNLLERWRGAEAAKPAG